MEQGRQGWQRDREWCSPIKQNATHAALLSGEIDFVLDRPRKIWNACINQKDDWKATPHHLQGLDRSVGLRTRTSGQEPVQDIRVREALYRASTSDAIKRGVMRDAGAGTMIAPQVHGWSNRCTSVPTAAKIARC